MGFQENIPPVPNRHDEVLAMQKLRQSWINQPYYKYYMNEALRTPKLRYSEANADVSHHFYFNCAVGAICLLPFFFMSRRFFIQRGNIPIFYKPDSFGKYRTDLDVKRTSFAKTMIPIYFFGVFAYAYLKTDFSKIIDPKYDYIHKPEKIM